MWSDWVDKSLGVAGQSDPLPRKIYAVSGLERHSYVEHPGRHPIIHGDADFRRTIERLLVGTRSLCSAKGGCECTRRSKRVPTAALCQNLTVEQFLPILRPSARAYKERKHYLVSTKDKPLPPRFCDLSLEQMRSLCYCLWVERSFGNGKRLKLWVEPPSCILELVRSYYA